MRCSSGIARLIAVLLLPLASFLAPAVTAQAAQAAPSAAPALLAAPAGLHVSTSADRATAAWNAVSGAAVYELRVTGSGGTAYDHVLRPGQRSAYAVLRPGRYAADVRAGRSAGDVHGHWSPSVPFTVPAAVTAVAASAASRAFAWALAQAGKPYAWGGTGPYGFDCSGLVMAAYEHAGIDLPRTTYEMLADGALHRTGNPVKGTLAFYGTGHVELYAGGDETFGAHDSGSVIGFIQEWEAPEYYNVT